MARWGLCFVMLLVAASASLCKATNPLYTLCPTTSNYTANSTFQRNLNTLFLSLSSNASINGFTTATAGETPDEVYGLVLCRGDVSAADCANCTSDATTQILQRCPSSKSSIIWFDNCFLRYSDQSFFGTVNTGFRYYMWNQNNVSDPTLFNSQLGNLMANLSSTATTDSSGRLFAAGETKFNDFQKIYGLVQCTRDLSSDGCSGCLSEGIGAIPACCNGKQGGRVLMPTCNIRYEVYPFFNASAINQPSQSPTGVASPPAGQPSGVSPPPSNASTTGSTTTNKSSRTTVIVVSILVPSALILCILATVLCIKKSKKKNIVAQSHRDHEEHIGSKESFIFDLSIIKAATNDFSQWNKLGEGGYGPVYKGELPDGQEIAVKRLSSRSGQGVIEFKNEVKLVAKLQHRNLVRLLGCCLEENEKILVYEYVPNRSLDYFLFDQTKRMQLDWLTRVKIINGIARGLLYLHEDSRLKIIHRDLKASNILLDKDMNPKISDFGMAKLVGLDETQGNTSRIAGTYGYMSPEYAMKGQFSVKSDVFSFGVLMLEIVSGQKISSFSQSQYGQDLLSYTWRLWTENKATELLDETLRESCQMREAVRCIHVGLLCVQEDPALRPTMSSVVLMLSSGSFTLVAPSTPAFFVGRSPMEFGSISTGSSVETTKLDASKGGSRAQSISSADFSKLDAR
ncbi:cysteine-rich receptor-like protein kinase 10 [Nymphaea colorata]|nr:cysteine-rich receptor-like protein kinase 10 [Nymphaea colorata]